MIDLHIHSCYSDDGEFTPTQLVEKFAKLEITVMSITDHNCVKANEEAYLVAQREGISYISGAEFDCIYGGSNFHILAYGIEYKSDDFSKIEKYIDDQSYQASLEMLDRTQALGFHVTENDLWQLSKNRFYPGKWTGKMFAETLLSKPENLNHPLLIPYRKGGVRSDNPYDNFYRDFYSHGKFCYVEIKYQQMEQIIDIIHRNRGIAVLAHPGNNVKEDEILLDNIISQGIDGIEIYSSHHNSNQITFYEKKARDRNLLITSGSDFHG